MSSAKKDLSLRPLRAHTAPSPAPTPEAYFFGMRRLRVGVFLSIYDPAPSTMKFMLSYTPVPDMQPRLGSHILRGGGQLLE